MTNALLRLRFTVSALFGMIPDAHTIEKKEKQLTQELERIDELASSERLKHYLEIKELVLSPQFKQKKKAINAQKFQGTPQHEKYKRYKALKRANDVKTYYKVKDSNALRQFNETIESKELKRFEELQHFFNSEQFTNFRNKLKAGKNRQKEKIKKTEKRYKTLKKDVKPYFKIEGSEALKRFNEVAGSDKLKRYEKLKDFVDKTDFKHLKNELKAKRKKLEKTYRENEKRLKELEKCKRKLEKKKLDPVVDEDELKDLRKKVDKLQLEDKLKTLKPENQDAFQKREEFRKLKKESDIRHYFKFKERKDYKHYLELKGSDKLMEFRKLDEWIKAGELQKMKGSLNSYEFKNTGEYNQYQEYKRLKKSKKIRDYFRFKQSKRLKIFNELDNSQKIKEYEELTTYVNSKEFIDFKKYMETRDKFKLSDEYKQLQEYKKLKKDKDIRWYYKNKDSHKYDEIKIWEITFEDDFDQAVLDSKKWITSYYSGQKLLNNNYVTGNAHHCHNAKENLQIKEGHLQLITRKQQMKGLAWDPDYGFLPKEFDYTSAIISSGDHFSQKYGRFSLKVRMDYVWPVMHACWFSGGTKLPEVDVFRLDHKSKKKLTMALHHNGNNPQSLRNLVSGYNFARDFVIFTLDWKPGEMIWKINNKKVKVEKQHIPDQTLFINLSSGIYSEQQPATLPATMEVDWVRVYKIKV